MRYQSQELFNANFEWQKRKKSGQDLHFCLFKKSFRRKSREQLEHFDIKLYNAKYNVW